MITRSIGDQVIQDVEWSMLPTEECLFKMRSSKYSWFQSDFYAYLFNILGRAERNRNEYTIKTLFYVYFFLFYFGFLFPLLIRHVLRREIGEATKYKNTTEQTKSAT